MAAETPDAILLRTYADQHANDAFAELVQRYLGVVFRAALRQLDGDAHAASDVAQAVFVLLARKAGELVNHESLVGWLHTTTRYMARDARRAASRRQFYEQEAMRMNEPHEPAADWEKVRPVVDQALGELNEGDRQAVLLRYFAALSFAAIGERLGIAENAARMRVERALDKLQVRLRTRGIDSTAAALGLVLSGEAAAGAVPPQLAGAIVSAAAALPASATGVGSALGFMTAGKTIGMVAVALLIATTGSIGYSLRVTAKAQRQLAATTTEVTELERQAKVASARADELERLAAQARQAASQTPSPGAAAEPAAPAAGAVLNPRQEGDALLARYPELKRAFGEWQRASAWSQYRDLIRTLHLTPEQTEQFLHIVMSGSTLQMGSGPTGKPVVLRSGDDNSLSDIVPQLRGLLGEEGVGAWAKYNNGREVRGAVTQLAADLTFSDEPLTAEQASALTTSLMGTLRSPAGQRLSPREIDWAEAIQRSQTILSAVQVDALTSIRDQNLLQRAQRMKRYPQLPQQPSAASTPRS